MKKLTLRTTALALLAAASGSAFAQQTFTFPGDVLSDPLGTFFTNYVTVGTTYTLGGNIDFLAGSLEEINTGTYSSEALIELQNSAFPTDWLTVQPFTGSGFTGTIPVVIGTRPSPDGTLIGKIIPAGSTWTAIFYESFDDGNDNLPDAKYINLSFATKVLTLATPPASVDLGTLNTTEKIEVLPVIAAASIQWYKINLGAINGGAGDYLDMYIDVDPTNVDVGPDTEFGIYRANGVKISNDDDSGEGLLSQMSFGDSASPRPPTDSGALINGLAFSGQDGSDLDAGSYYVAVGRFNTTFNAVDFAVTSIATSEIAAGLQLIFKTNAPAAGLAISGVVSLQDYIPSAAGQICAWSLLDGSSNIVDSGSVTLGAGGAYTINAAASAGTYTVVMKGTHWLASGNESVVLPGGSQNFSLINGDADGDNFIGLDDFNVLSNSFNLALGDPGYAANADFDGDDFVGLDDFNILSNNFNTGGYGS